MSNIRNGMDASALTGTIAIEPESVGPAAVDGPPWLARYAPAVAARAITMPTAASAPVRLGLLSSMPTPCRPGLRVPAPDQACATASKLSR